MDRFARPDGGGSLLGGLSDTNLVIGYFPDIIKFGRLWRVNKLSLLLTETYGSKTKRQLRNTHDRSDVIVEQG